MYTTFKCLYTSTMLKIDISLLVANMKGVWELIHRTGIYNLGSDSVNVNTIMKFWNYYQRTKRSVYWSIDILGILKGTIYTTHIAPHIMHVFVIATNLGHL